jgi:WD40 repeat protein
MVDDRNIGLSASYDSNVIIWNLDSLQLLKTCTLDAAVVAMDWRNSLMVGGTRGGQVSLWDINTCQCLVSFNNHAGQVAKTKLYSDGSDTHLVASTGSNDGRVVVRDMRTHEAVFNRQVHRGAINFLEVRLDNCLVTGSFDQTIKVWDAAAGFADRAEVETTGGVLCGQLTDSLAVVGCTDGNILVYDLDLQECCFGFGADSQGGVNCLAVGLGGTRLITGGDSGIPLMLSFD